MNTSFPSVSPAPGAFAQRAPPGPSCSLPVKGSKIGDKRDRTLAHLNSLKTQLGIDLARTGTKPPHESTAILPADTTCSGDPRAPLRRRLQDTSQELGARA